MFHFRASPVPPRKAIAATSAALVLAALAGLSQSQAQQQTAAPPPLPQPSPVGTWIDHTGRGAVEIVPCGNELCGRIIWMKAPADKQGRPLRDGLNPEKALRARSICGLPIIGGLKPQRDGSWDNGWIYDPEQGAHFDVEIRLRGANGLQVKGYKGVKFLSETFQWTRAPAPPEPRCPEA